MRLSRVALALVLATTGLVAAPKDAHALGPVGLEIGAKGGLGTQPSNTAGNNPLGFGLGARGGVTFMNFYGGVNFMYYFGGSDGTTFDHSLMYGVEGGYGFKLLDILTIRPQIGVGNFTLTGGVNNGPSASNSNLYVEPGVTVLVGLGTFFVGGDANLLVLPGVSNGEGGSSTDTAFTIHAQVGVQF